MEMEFSVVVPICNEEANLLELYQRLAAVLDGLCERHNTPKDRYEIIFVDDGSSDASWSVIKALHEKDLRVKGVSFSRNFGHHMAITAGMDHASGRAVILMDGDLQDPPEEIGKIYAKFTEGYDIVYGIRENRHDHPIKKFNSNLFWWFISRVSGIDMPIGQTMLRILSARMVKTLREMRETARFVHGMMAWTGYKSARVEVKHSPRTKGRTKYNIWRQLKLAFFAITSFSTRPLAMAAALGFLTASASLIVGIYFAAKSFIYGLLVPGWASIIVSVFFIGGIQLLVLGIIGEYVGRIYQESQQRPLYITNDSLF